MNSDPYNTIAEHCAKTLPDSMIERKVLLRALEHVLTERHPALRPIRAQLAAIKAIEHLQDQLPFHFRGKRPRPQQGDGHN